MILSNILDIGRVANLMEKEKLIIKMVITIKATSNVDSGMDSVSLSSIKLSSIRGSGKIQSSKEMARFIEMENCSSKANFKMD